MVNVYSYSQAKYLAVCGDIHGEFETLVYKICVQYDMHDTLVIVAGDCGFGFHAEEYYKQLYHRVQKRLSAHNCFVAMMRGNHDDPSYFAEQKLKYERFRTIPDYSIIEACGHQILCVGGAVSIDRKWRKDEMARYPDKTYYWEGEIPYYDEKVLKEITSSGCHIDIVISHTSPSFCELVLKNGLAGWAKEDAALLDDTTTERKVLDEVLEYLVKAGHPLCRWYYGHFHQSWHSEIEGVFYKMLDIMELQEVSQ